MELTREQQAAVALRNRTVLVSAAAGAGKTRVLVERLMGYITQEGRNIDDFLVVTYTRAAAGEMRGRILSRLKELSEQQPENAHLREQLLRVYTARIGTLDAYCREILLENAGEAGIPSGYRTGDNAVMEILRERVLEETLDALYQRAENDPGDVFRHCADTYGDERGDRTLGELILHIWSKTRCHADPACWLFKVAQAFSNEESAGIIFDQALCITETFIRDYKAMSGAVCEGILGATYGITLKQELNDMELLAKILRKGGWDEAAQFLEGYSFETLKQYRGGGAPPEAAAFKELRERWKKTVFEKLKRLIYGTAERHLRDAAELKPLLAGLCDAVAEFDAALTAEKLRLSMLEFSDVERMTLSLLVRDGVKTALSEKLSLRFAEILVDEVQDINPLQDAIINALSREGKNIFYVGDARQSIYRFQMAEPSIFLEKYNKLPLYTQAEEGQACKVLLTSNFRSEEAILNAVNTVFSRIECPEMGALREENFLQSGKKSGASPHAVEMLITSEYTVEREAQSVANRLRELVESGRAGPGECVILMRSPKNRLAVYQKALGAQGLPCASTGGGYIERPEIQTVLSALEAVSNARLDVALIAVLRSPAVSCSPDELAALRMLSPESALCDCLPLSENAKIEAFREMFYIWRTLSAELPPYALAARILADTQLPAKVDITARENLLLLPELLRDYAGGELRTLPEWLRRQHEAGVAAGGQGDSVRIMSIHGSKGLEFPVVVVADLQKKLNLQDQNARLLAHPRLGLGLRRREALSEYPTPSYRAVQSVMDSETRSEELRLLYVAMTRAQRHLILSLPEREEESCGAVTRGELILSPTVASWLQKTNPPFTAVYAKEQPEKECVVNTAGIAENECYAWKYPYAEAVDTPSKMTATGIKGRFPDEQTHENAADVFERAESPVPKLPLFLEGEVKPGGAEKGTAMHLFMQFADFSRCAAPNGAEEEAKRLVERGLLTSAQAELTDARAVRKLFENPLGKELLAARDLKRELKFSLLVQNGDIPGISLPEGEKVLLQGVIDCCYETSGGFVIVDFKTDRVKRGEEAARAKRYKAQIDAYETALRAITGRPVCCRTLYFFATQCELNI